jgi:uncharacterized protein YdaT
MRWIELDFEDWDWCKDRNRDRLDDVECIDDEQFREALIQDVEIRETENINKRIKMLWLKWDAFVY